MTQNEIIELSEQAKIGCTSSIGFIVYNTTGLKELEAFTHLVIEKEKQRCVELIKDFTPRSGHQTPEYLFAQKLIAAIEGDV